MNSRIKWLFILAAVLVMGTISNVFAYNILHDVAPDSGQIITHAIEMTFTDVAGNISSATAPYIESTSTIAARYDFLLVYDASGGWDARKGEDWDSVLAATRHADSDPYRDTINGDTYYSYKEVSPAETICIPWGILTDSNDSTTNTFDITISQSNKDADYVADSLAWSILFDTTLSGDSIAQDVFSSLGDNDAEAGPTTTTVINEFDTMQFVTYVSIPTSAFDGAGTLTITVKATHSTPGANKNPDWLYLVQALEIAAPDMHLEKTVNLLTYNTAGIKPGDTIMYTVVDTNAGNGNAYNINIIDTLPSWTYDGANDTYVWLVKSYNGNDVAPDSSGNDGASDNCGFDTILVSQDGGASWVSINTLTASIVSVNDDNDSAAIYPAITGIRFVNDQHDKKVSADTPTYNKAVYYVMIPWVQYQ